MQNTFPEPIWTVPQDAIDRCTAFDIAGPSPFMLTGAVLRLLQYHFSDPNNIEEPLLKGYIWSPNTANCIQGQTQVQPQPSPDGAPNWTTIPESRIVIKPSWSSTSDGSQQLPGIYVKREPFRTETVSFKDQQTPSLDAQGVFKGTTMNVNILGAHSLICKGMTGAEAELLGQEVYFRMLHYQQVIKSDLKLGRLQTTGVSEAKQRLDEARSTFYTVVSLEWAYVYRWLVVQESPIVKRIAFGFVQ